jgi:hypothetical protein
MGMPARHYYSAAEVLAMPEDGNRYEVVHGELLVNPGPRLVHQLVVFRLTELIGAYLRRYPVGVGLSWWQHHLVTHQHGHPGPAGDGSRRLGPLIGIASRLCCWWLRC